ncbi:unnamed protein product [Cylicocyclus nassatus]|uniref:Arrestin C-terminal-like domain-containing protein n=1 Tax=Cylicocyclus nassatus TaxID=53992 RepID=A0AA36GS08_CYLNA|nr:unnamed protein product [Cylicocyclus nassatus]
MPENRLYITYSNPNGVFCPGSNVEGIVHLDLKEKIKAKSLRITVDGRAYTHWSATHSRKILNKDGSTRMENYSVPYSATVIYVTGDSLAWASPQGKKEVLRSGSYQFPFVFTLPLTCAPSFEGLYGYIRYMVKVELDRPWRFNKCDQKPFTVVPIFDLNTNPTARLPVREVKVKNLGIILFRSGKVTIQCEMAKSGFVPGETIVINATIDNDSSSTITKAHVKLVEYSRYVAYEQGNIIRQGIFINACGHNYRELRRKLATGHQKLCINKKSKSVAQIYLQVPPTVPSFNMCPIISVEYYLEVKFETSGALNSGIESTYPIVLGTVPVQAQTVVVTQPTAPPFMEFPSSSAVSPAIPSAPPMESPPPYMNSNNGEIAFQPPPPSYEECIQGVQGTTMDTENIEPFAPRYPFYPSLTNTSSNLTSEKNGVLGYKV